MSLLAFYNMPVINDILDLSKLEANKMELEEIPSNIYDVVEKSIEVVGFEAEKKVIDLICNIDSSVPFSFICDPIR